MMKRQIRGVGDAPKFRRMAKGRTGRLGDSACFLYNLVYLKLVMVWLGCIALDFAIGFRFELLWPVWLLMRHLYESFRTQAFSSSLHYSAFSVFFICVTATSDLVCYLFIPLQVLIFIASTCVWVQFVYSSTDRGVCLPSLCLWVLFLVFEYSMRYKFDNTATWYLAKGSWITAGLLPSTADSVVLGAGSTSAGSPTFAAPRLELYRPFAAHSVGFPLVMLGFRIKSLLSSWRLRIRRHDVRGQNEFCEKVLAAAVPQTFEERRHFISSRHYTIVEQQDGIESSEALGEVCQSAAIIKPSAEERSTLLGFANSSATSGGFGAALQLSSAQQQGHPISLPIMTTAGRKGVQHRTLATGTHISTASTTASQPTTTLLNKRGGRGAATSCWRAINGQSQLVASAEHSISADRASGKKREAVRRLISYPSRHEPFLVIRLWRFIFIGLPKLLITALCSLINLIVSRLFAGSFGARAGLIPAAVEEDSTTLADGPHLAAEEESDQEDNLQLCGTAHSPGQQQSVGKRKGKRVLAKQHAAAMTKCNSATNLVNGAEVSHTANGHANGTMISESRGEQPASCLLYSSCNGKESGSHANSTWSTVKSIADSTQHTQQRTKVEVEQPLERLKSELKLQKILENELRSQLFQTQYDLQQQEKQHRLEATQFKAKVDQLEGKCKNLAKQAETSRLNATVVEKKLGELQLRKLELEKELASAERSRQSNAKQLSKDDFWTASNGAAKSNEFNDPSALVHSLRSKTNALEREIKSLKREIRTKDEQASKMDEDIRILRQLNRQTEQDDDHHKELEKLREKNYLLEQTLSSENRLKQDLFQALNDSKAQIETLKIRLEQLSGAKEGGASDKDNNFTVSSLFGGITPPLPPPSYSSLAMKSITPPPITVAPSLNLDQLMQATGAGKHMSYSLTAMDGDGQRSETADEFKTPTADPLPGLTISDFLAIGSQRHCSSQQQQHNHQLPHSHRQ